MWKPGKGPAALPAIVGAGGAVASGWEQGWGWLAHWCTKHISGT